MTMTMKGGGEYKSETGSQGILLRDTTTSSYHHRHDGHVNHDHSADDHENDEDLQDDHIGVGFHFVAIFVPTPIYSGPSLDLSQN